MEEGFRGWFLSKDKKLVSASRSFTWEQAEVTAKCNHGCDVGFCLRNHQCTCGLYSLKGMQAVLSAYPNMDIYGGVFNHGTVIEGTMGSRSESATISSLYTADIALADRLIENYPGVSILIPTSEMVAAMTSWYKHSLSSNNWEAAARRRQERQTAVITAIKAAQVKYPGGPEEEKQRLLKLLRGATRAEIVKFAKSYGSSPEWAERNWLGKVENSRKAKPGDIIFEANDDTKPYVFIGSARPNRYASMRYMFGRNGFLYKRGNIRRWNEDADLTASRLQAIEEWE